MRISELATQNEVQVATIKYYLREQLLPQGSVTWATQATYDDSPPRTAATDPRLDRVSRPLHCANPKRAGERGLPSRIGA